MECLNWVKWVPSAYPAVRDIVRCYTYITIFLTLDNFKLCLPTGILYLTYSRYERERFIKAHLVLYKDLLK